MRRIQFKVQHAQGPDVHAPGVLRRNPASLSFIAAGCQAWVASLIRFRNVILSSYERRLVTFSTLLHACCDEHVH